MRIWYQYPAPVDSFRRDVVWRSVQAIADRVRRPETEIEIVPVARGAAIADGGHDARRLANTEIIDTITGANEGGYDGAVIGVSSDAGLLEAREILTVPVVGLTEAACHFAAIWGDRFGIITNPHAPGPGHLKDVHYRREQLARYGVLDRLVGLEPLDMPAERFRQDLAARRHDEILTRYEAQARRLVEQGADVILSGDTILSMALVEHHFVDVPGTGAVVVDLISCAIKLIEALVDIRRAFGIVCSRAGIYAGMRPESVMAVRHTFSR
ncbi:MAG: Asp/Glu/hydantoin racemase [Dehalococcoidia bacterium]|nr:MAG: Asp/Glu/hydantoin racemase [Dehalococcoidia bacterium]